MSGLIEKDFRLMLQRKSTLLFITAIAVLMSFTMEGTFVAGYFTVLGVIFSSSTISYDEYDNGYPFLLTLPIDRKLYVQEKYVFCFLSGLFAWIFACALYLVACLIRGIALNGSEVIVQLCGFLPVIVILTAIMIPFPLKFGAEKGRIVMALVCGGLFAGGIFLSKGLKQGNQLIGAVMRFVNSLSEAVTVLLVAVILIIGLLISYRCSRHIMEKKEF